MPWRNYLAILRRRWLLIVAVLALDVVVSGFLFLSAYQHRGYQGCITLLVEDASAPGLISAPQTALQSTGALLSGETAANFFGDDILDVAQSSSVTRYVSRRLPRSLPDSSPDALNGSVSGARKDRTVNLCVSNPNSATALAAARQLGIAMTLHRARFFGPRMTQRTYVAVISPAGVTPTSTGHDRLNLVLRLVLGGLVAIGLALAWEALDPTVRTPDDVERTLGVPVFATLR